jgi:uncharacterized protein (TIGR03067 family)
LPQADDRTPKKAGQAQADGKQATERGERPEPASPGPANQEVPDAGQLQGSWELVSAEKSGNSVTGAEFEQLAKQFQLVLERDKYYLRLAGKETSGTIALGKAEALLTITFLDEKKEVFKRGIYQVTDGGLRICWGLSANAPRPSEFATTPSSNTAILVLKRHPQSPM